MPRYNFDSKILIDKGWSKDKKYCIEDEKGNKYLLRISPLEEYEKKKAEFEIMHKLASMHIPMCEALEFGTLKEGIYSIQTYIDGEDFEEVINNFSKDEQYAYGLKAGKLLKIMHSISLPTTNIENWDIRFNKKIDKRLENYQKSPIKYDGGQAFIDYIKSHRYLLKGRPQSFQHGDYHIGNMMLDRNNDLYIIDFNRFDYGDPWEEFNRIVWCAQASPYFASAMINAYFNDEIPEEFWKLLALYIATNTISSVVWAIPFGQAEIDTMLKQAQDILSWYGNMTKTIPNWYIKCL